MEKTKKDPTKSLFDSNYNSYYHVSTLIDLQLKNIENEFRNFLHEEDFMPYYIEENENKESLKGWYLSLIQSVEMNFSFYGYSNDGNTKIWPEKRFSIVVEYLMSRNGFLFRRISEKLYDFANNKYHEQFMFMSSHDSCWPEGLTYSHSLQTGKNKMKTWIMDQIGSLLPQNANLPANPIVCNIYPQNSRKVAVMIHSVPDENSKRDFVPAIKEMKNIELVAIESKDVTYYSSQVKRFKNKVSWKVKE